MKNTISYIIFIPLTEKYEYHCDTHIVIDA